MTREEAAQIKVPVLIAVGTTDDIGWKVAEHPVAWHDFHATVLHLLGLDHEKLTFRHNGANRRLTDVHGQIVREVLASLH